MDLLETLRNITVREGFEAGRSVREVSEETGLSVLEVLRREMDMHLIPEGPDIVRSALSD